MIAGWSTFRRTAAARNSEGNRCYTAAAAHLAEWGGTLGRKSGNRRVADVVAARDLHQRLAVVAPLDRFGPLVRGELRLAAHLQAARLRPCPAFPGGRPDEVALELCVMRCTA